MGTMAPEQAFTMRRESVDRRRRVRRTTAVVTAIVLFFYFGFIGMMMYRATHRPVAGRPPATRMCPAAAGGGASGENPAPCPRARPAGREPGPGAS